MCLQGYALCCGCNFGFVCCSRVLGFGCASFVVVVGIVFSWFVVDLVCCYDGGRVSVVDLPIVG